MFTQIECDCPVTEGIAKQFRAVADFYSIFFNVAGKPNAVGGERDELIELLHSEELSKAIPKLVPLDLSAAKLSTVMNRYEFEGSLVGALLQGTCTDRVVCDEREAFEKARAMMQEVVLRPNGHIRAFRMDDPKWSALTNQATLSWAYFVFETSQDICWFLCFADSY